MADAEDDELGGLDGGDANDADESAVVEVVLCHGGSIAFYEERIFGFVAEEGASAPLSEEEVADGVADACPEVLAVGLEDNPLDSLFDGVLDEVEEASDVDVFPLGVGRDGSCSPYEGLTSESAMPGCGW